jgi:hypothetical protein
MSPARGLDANKTAISIIFTPVPGYNFGDIGASKS